MIRSIISAVGFVLLVLQPGFAADKAVSLRHHRQVLTSQNHVIEVVTPPYSGVFITNGFLYAGINEACRSWVPGERVRLVSGSWTGACTAAIFYNVTRHSTCETVCRGAGFY